MIALDHQVSTITLSGNPVLFSFSSDSSLESTGVPATLTVSFTTAGSEGESITLTWVSGSVTFIFRDEPDDSGLELSSRQVEAILNKWVEIIAGEIGSNYLVDRFYRVSFLGNTLTLAARNPGSEYTLALTSDDNLGVIAESIEGEDAIIRPFFKVGIQVVLGTGESTHILGEEYLPVDTTGSATFDLHEYFSDSATSLTFPEASDNLAILHPESCREYYVRYFEQYGIPPVARKINTAGPFYVLNGGLSGIQLGKYRREGSDFWAKLCYNQYFLTWQPKTKWVDPYQSEKLFYLVREEYPSIVMRVETYFTSGFSTNPVPKVLIENPVKMGVYEFICTLAVLQLDGWDTEFIDYYEVWIEDDQVNRISEIRRFNVAHETPPFARYFLFQNSLGGWDTLRTTGKGSSAFEYERSTASRIPGFDFTDLDHHLIQYQAREDKTITASTGWLTVEEADWIRDFCLSPQVYEIIGQQLIPIVIMSKSARQAKDGENLWFLDFEYTRSMTSGYHTREVVGASFNTDFNDDYFDR